MKEAYSILKETAALQIFPKNSFTEYEQQFPSFFKKIYSATDEKKAQSLLKKHKDEIDIIISDSKPSFDVSNIEVEVLSSKTTKLTDILSKISKKAKKSLDKKKKLQDVSELQKLLHEEQEKNKKLMQTLLVAKQKADLFNFVADELLVKFEINKDGIVSSISKNFAEIFGFREKYIVNEDISKIVHGSILQKTLLDVTRSKKPEVRYITFNTKTGVIIEPIVAVAPNFDETTGYLDTYTLYCSLQ